MIAVTWKIPAKMRKDNPLDASVVEDLRWKINNEEYVGEAIQRIALILSNELLDIPNGGGCYEQHRKGRK
ncbi:MAG: hypothetical protein LBQ67_04785 [Treponema sp.]|jgi:hypothetical protein|nr:hypothetical protein [Treponema sp.]